MIYRKKMKKLLMSGSMLLAILLFAFNGKHDQVASRHVTVNKDGSLHYVPDEQGNIIPDFSRVGYRFGEVDLPQVKVVKRIKTLDNEDCTKHIQDAIDEVSQMKPDKNGHRGSILLEKGMYKVKGTLNIQTSGVVLRGEGDHEDGTKVIATGTGKRSLVKVTGQGELAEVPATRAKITDKYVPVGAFSFTVENAKGYKKGDDIVLFYKGTPQWISDLKMDQIEKYIETKPQTTPRKTKQWKPQEYDLHFERKIVEISGDRIIIDNPVLMPIEERYEGAEIYKYSFSGRIDEVGVENILFESEYKSEKDEDHGWNAVEFDKAENCWAKNLTARYFGNACVLIQKNAKLITVQDSRCYDAKSIKTGGRRYSFSVNGQLNLVKNCETKEGRHDYVTGAKTLGPNVFYNCKATNAWSDSGPHHRWSVGTLYDNIKTDGDINVHDRGNWGTGHGWSGTTQVFWNCEAKKMAVQNPWVSGKNYAIGIVGDKYEGRLSGRPDGEWDSMGEKVQPISLYMAQINAQKKK